MPTFLLYMCPVAIVLMKSIWAPDPQVLRHLIYVRPQMLSGIKPMTLDDHISNSVSLRELGMNTRYLFSLSAQPTNSSSSALDLRLLTSRSLSYADCATKSIYLIIASLGFILRLSSAGQLSFGPTIKFIFAAWRIASHQIILGSPESMSNNLTISSSVLWHHSDNPVFCGVSIMVFFRTKPANKEGVLNCSEPNSLAISYLSFFGVAHWPVLHSLP